MQPQQPTNKWWGLQPLPWTLGGTLGYFSPLSAMGVMLTDFQGQVIKMPCTQPRLPGTQPPYRQGT